MDKLTYQNDKIQLIKTGELNFESKFKYSYYLNSFHLFLRGGVTLVNKNGTIEITIENRLDPFDRSFLFVIYILFFGIYMITLLKGISDLNNAYVFLFPIVMSGVGYIQLSTLHEESVDVIKRIAKNPVPPTFN
ncbi:hypothetical protein LVD15_15370 [Fulvivirga maritima]|uniref:hypothetical protein n=1 Tax=Fulvivirga maritima TaxID=2904247 RepID=UPI001F22EDC0|nr:hypothetical protein [Fulvivirga maritima]UII24694.1 hypothetical protein LVD15_15370 [Fulvivirga maritima]